MNRGHAQNSLIKLLRDNGFSANAEYFGQYRSIPFYNNKRISGELKVFSPEYITLKWEGSCRSLPFTGMEKFTSVDSAKIFIENYVSKERSE